MRMRQISREALWSAELLRRFWELTTNEHEGRGRRPRIIRLRARLGVTGADGADEKNDEIRIPNDERMPTVARESPTFAGLRRGRRE
jgi:hypothetical protein